MNTHTNVLSLTAPGSVWVMRGENIIMASFSKHGATLEMQTQAQLLTITTCQKLRLHLRFQGCGQFAKILQKKSCDLCLLRNDSSIKFSAGTGVGPGFGWGWALEDTNFYFETINIHVQ